MCVNKSQGSGMVIKWLLGESYLFNLYITLHSRIRGQFRIKKHKNELEQNGKGFKKRPRMGFGSLKGGKSNSRHRHLEQS